MYTIKTDLKKILNLPVVLGTTGNWKGISYLLSIFYGYA